MLDSESSMKMSKILLRSAFFKHVILKLNRVQMMMMMMRIPVRHSICQELF